MIGLGQGQGCLTEGRRWLRLVAGRLSRDDAQDVLPSGWDTVLFAQRFGKGRVIAFGAGSAMQNQSLNSRIIHHATAQKVQSNTKLAMNLALGLVSVDGVAASK